MVHALRRIHAALKAGGVLIDTQPVSPEPPIVAAGSTIGELDMREWLETINAVDTVTAEIVEAGVYSIQAEQPVHRHRYPDSGPECARTVVGWQGTRLPEELAKRIAAASPPLTADQKVRLRVLRARYRSPGEAAAGRRARACAQRLQHTPALLVSVALARYNVMV